jgi:hypothetical protein
LFEQLFNPDLNLTNISSIATSAILITDELRLKFCIEERSDVQIFDADNYDEICVKDLRSQHNNKRLVIVDYHC